MYGAERPGDPEAPSSLVLPPTHPALVMIFSRQRAFAGNERLKMRLQYPGLEDIDSEDGSGA